MIHVPRYESILPGTFTDAITFLNSCDVLSCEVTRVLKLCDDGVQPVSVTIPRRDKMRFHEELFPPAPGKVHLPFLVEPVFVVHLHHPTVVQ